MEAVTEYDSSFRTWQAVSDLVHHAGPLAKLHFEALARASGLTPRATGDALALLRDDGFCFRRDETLALMDGLEVLAIQGEQGFDLATVILLTDLLQTRRGSPLLVDVWAEAGRRLRDWPATLRAAMAHGLVRAVELGLVALDAVPTMAERLTRGPEEIAEGLLQIARSMRPDELLAVAQSDRGSEVERHLTALRQVISLRDGIFLTEESWYPSEVVELTAHMPDQQGFAGCTAILLLNVLKQGDRMDWMAFRWEVQAATYCGLKPSQRDPILAGIWYIYETDPGFLGNASVDFNPAQRRAKKVLGRERWGVTIPVVADV